jgi:hypothetical protein
MRLEFERRRNCLHVRIGPLAYTRVGALRIVWIGRFHLLGAGSHWKLLEPGSEA